MSLTHATTQIHQTNTNITQRLRGSNYSPCRIASRAQTGICSDTHDNQKHWLTPEVRATERERYWAAKASIQREFTTSSVRMWQGMKAPTEGHTTTSQLQGHTSLTCWMTQDYIPQTAGEETLSLCWASTIPICNLVLDFLTGTTSLNTATTMTERTSQLVRQCQLHCKEGMSIEGMWLISTPSAAIDWR